MITFVKNVRSHYHSFRVLVGVNIKTTVLSTRLGWLWWVLDPIFLMAIYYFLIKGIFGRGGENYHIFVLTGLVSWQFFARSITDSMAVIPSNIRIIQQVAFPLPLLVAVPIVTRFFFAIIGIVIVIVFDYSMVGVNTLAVFPILFVIALYSFAVGLIVSVVNVFVGDIKQFIAYILRAGFFLTPILYPASRLLDAPNIPDLVKSVLQLNPMMWTISALREVLLVGGIYSWQEYFYVLIAGLSFVQLGLVLMRLNASQIIKSL